MCWWLMIISDMTGVGVRCTASACSLVASFEFFCSVLSICMSVWSNVSAIFQIIFLFCKYFIYII